MTKPIRILPSLLNADWGHLGKAVKGLESNGCQTIHLDVMDGHFVPEITFGSYVFRSLLKGSQAHFDAHLMVSRPQDQWEYFAKEQTRFITVHAEAAVHLHRLLSKIKDSGCGAGVALNPATPLSAIHYMLDYIDLILIMTVSPGFGGQAFIPAMLDKLRDCRQWLQDKGRDDIQIEVDGGLKLGTIEPVIEAGGNLLVVGTGIFGQPDPMAAYREMRAAIERG